MRMEIPTVTGETADGLVDFVRVSLESAGCRRAVIGLSGGLDSAVVAKITSDAIGGENVTCIFMPLVLSQSRDRADAKAVAELCGAVYREIPIGGIVDSFIEGAGDGSPVDRGNIAARARMTVLYDRARKDNALVVGTSNLSERMMGYFTKHGDGACDIAPIANLFKTQIKEVAEIVGIPKDLIDKAPSAGFWEGQTDEDELGMTYDSLDIILCGIGSGLSDEEICCMTEFEEDAVALIRRRVDSNAHKRELPPSLTFSTSL